MANSYFQFKEFTVYQERCVTKVTTDACLFGAWAAEDVRGETPDVKNVLDIGTGTGLLSLMLAQKNPSAIIDAIEIDNEAYEQAKENLAISPFQGKMHLINQDVKTYPFSKKYDVMISNPPFYEREITSADPKKNIAHHHSGLLLEELLSIIKKNLSPEGTFYLLLPFKRNEEVKKMLLRQNLSICKLVFVRQSTQHDYFRIMIAGKFSSANEGETMVDEMSIWDDQQQYTPEFVTLLRSFYLNLET